MIQDAPAYLGVRLGAGVVQRIGAAAENVRLVKLEAGPAELSRLDRAARRRVRGLGRRRRHVPARLHPERRRRDHPRRRPRRRARAASTRPRHAASSALADERLREVLPMLVFEMQHSIDHYNACAKHDPRPARRARARRAAPARRRARRRLAGAARAASRRPAAHEGSVSVSADGRARRSEGLREPQRLSQQLSTLLAAEIVSGRIGVGRGVPLVRGDRHRVRRQPHGRARDGAGARDARDGEHPARQAHRGLPARGLGHPQRDRAGGAAARGQGRAAAARPLRVPPADRAAGGRLDGRARDGEGAGRARRPGRQDGEPRRRATPPWPR